MKTRYKDGNPFYVNSIITIKPLLLRYWLFSGLKIGKYIVGTE